MARQRNYRAEYEARKARARTKGFTGYGQQRRFQDRQITDIIENDPAFGDLPDELKTRKNAILYRKGWLYVGQGTSEQSKARREFRKIAGDRLDFGVWKTYYKDVIYPTLTGKTFAGWQPIVVNRAPMTVDEWEDMMQARIVSEQELEE